MIEKVGTQLYRIEIPLPEESTQINQFLRNKSSGSKFDY